MFKHPADANPDTLQRKPAAKAFFITKHIITLFNLSFIYIWVVINAPVCSAQSKEQLMALFQQNISRVEPDIREELKKAYAREPGYHISGKVKNQSAPSVLIYVKGKEWLKWGNTPEPEMAFSVSKSVLSACFGLALKKNLLSSIDETVSLRIQDSLFLGERHSKITWRHLLEQNSDWSGCLFGYCDWADRPPETGGQEEWKNRSLHAPGTRFEYNDVRVNLLAYALTALFQKSLEEVFREEIMNPMGASNNWSWNGYGHWKNPGDGALIPVVSGGGHFGGGLIISAEDLMKFALLYANHGKSSHGQILDSTYIAASIMPSEPEPAYGLLWWNNSTEKWKGLDAGVYSADGFAGHYIVIHPAHEWMAVLRWIEPQQSAAVLRAIDQAIMTEQP
jgi:CubicO group peptidase (beta-lactamase class C family)